MSPRILVVDDEPSLVRGLTYALERDKFEVEVATDGEAAVEAALTQAIDLVILDLMLPKLSGEEACKKIRETSDVPIIMLTAKDSERELLTGLELGADDYVTKPFSAAELIARVSALLRRRQLDHAASEQVVRTVGAIKIDLVRDEVSVEGKPVALTPSEFKILGLLAGAPGLGLHAAADHGAPLGQHVHRGRAHLRGACLCAPAEDRARPRVAGAPCDGPRESATRSGPPEPIRSGRRTSARRTGPGPAQAPVASRLMSPLPQLLPGKAPSPNSSSRVPSNVMLLAASSTEVTRSEATAANVPGMVSIVRTRRECGSREVPEKIGVSTLPIGPSPAATANPWQQESEPVLACAVSSNVGHPRAPLVRSAPAFLRTAQALRERFLTRA